MINVQYILTLLAQLYDADAPEQPKIRNLILDSVAGEIEMRSKRELIQKFIDGTLPDLASAAEIPDSIEDFWEQERMSAFEQLVKEEQLDADKLKKRSILHMCVPSCSFICTALVLFILNTLIYIMSLTPQQFTKDNTKFNR